MQKRHEPQRHFTNNSNTATHHPSTIHTEVLAMLPYDNKEEAFILRRLDDNNNGGEDDDTTTGRPLGALNITTCCASDCEGNKVGNSVGLTVIIFDGRALILGLVDTLGLSLGANTMLGVDDGRWTKPSAPLRKPPSQAQHALFAVCPILMQQSPYASHAPFS